MLVINPAYPRDPMALDYLREFQDLSRITKGGGPSDRAWRARGASLVAWEKGKPAPIGGGYFYWRVFVRLRDADEWIPCHGNKPTEAWWPRDLFTPEQIEEHRARLAAAPAVR
jgi:hypothetical protein